MGEMHIADSGPLKKSKLDLQIEAALKKKEAEEGNGQDEPEEAPKKKSATENPAVKEAPKMGAEHVVYGAPDDEAWTDKSQATKEAESKTQEIDDVSFCSFLAYLLVLFSLVFAIFVCIVVYPNIYVSYYFSCFTVRMGKNSATRNAKDCSKRKQQ